MFVFLIVSFLLHKTSGVPTVTYRNGLLVKEVPCGETVLFQCKSNIKNYNFDYWLFNNGKIVIGPSNTYDRLKYRYEILSGNLTVRAVTKEDAGLYSCISEGVRGDSIRVEHVQLEVLQGWQPLTEHDSSINTIRILVILIVLVILGAGAFYLYTMWRDRYRFPRYLEQEEDDDDDESAEEIFSAPSTSGTSRMSKPTGNIVQEKNNAFDTISTDFKSILDTANNK